ncbi:hypothetical protein DXG01_001174 [Tephrocybe rancida]|nr:hypothetical protein DXG01_001174 [Tephrocybe rancida]
MPALRGVSHKHGDRIVVSKMIYYYLVTSFGIPQNLAVANWEWSLYLGLSSLSAFSVQAYYARRTYLLTQSWLLFLLTLSLAIGQLGFGLATMSEAFHLVVLAKFPSVTWIAVTWLSFAAACDFLITIIQVVYLHRHRSGIAATNKIVKILSLYIMSTGLLTSVVALLELTTFATLGFNFVHVFLSHVMGAIYAVSFIANLDSRRTVRMAKTDPVTLSQSVTTQGDHSLNIMFRKGQVKVQSHTNVDTFPSEATKFSDPSVTGKTSGGSVYV